MDIFDLRRKYFNERHDSMTKTKNGVTNYTEVYVNWLECEVLKLNLAYVSNSETAVCVIHGCNNVMYKRGACRECYLKLYNTY